MCVGRLQLTLGIFKPDVTAQPHIIKEIISMILGRNLFIVRSKNTRLSREKSAEFYKDHEGKFFHRRLVNFMSSGPLSAHILAGENAVEEWRKLMGPTKVLRTIYEQPDSIRGRFGLTDTRNCTHGSDSDESAAREIQFFFPEFNISDWYKQEEPLFRKGRLKYSEDQRIHVIES